MLGGIQRGILYIVVGDGPKGDVVHSFFGGGIPRRILYIVGGGVGIPRGDPVHCWGEGPKGMLYIVEERGDSQDDNVHCWVGW